MKTWHRWQDWVNVVAGIWLFATPWLFGYTSETAISWSAWTVGVLIAAAGLWGLYEPDSRGAEWSLLALGVWTFVTPGVFGLTGIDGIAWNAWIVGAVAAVLSGWVLLEPHPSDIIHGSPQHT
jgi:hypothetical protein